MSGRPWRRERWSVGYESKRQAHDHRHTWPGGGKYSNRAVKAAEDLRREPGQGRPLPATSLLQSMGDDVGSGPTMRVLWYRA